MKAKPIPRDLKAGDIIVDNHGERHIVLEYHDDGDIDCGWAIFRPDGHRWKTTDGFAVKIIRKTSKPKKDADAEWLRKLADTIYYGHPACRRIRKIAKRLEGIQP